MLSRVFSSTTVWKYQFFGAQPSLWSNSHIHTFPRSPFWGGQPDISLAALIPHLPASYWWICLLAVTFLHLGISFWRRRTLYVASEPGKSSQWLRAQDMLDGSWMETFVDCICRFTSINQKRLVLSWPRPFLQASSWGINQMEAALWSVSQSFVGGLCICGDLASDHPSREAMFNDDLPMAGYVRATFMGV